MDALAPAGFFELWAIKWLIDSFSECLSDETFRECYRMNLVIASIECTK